MAAKKKDTKVTIQNPDAPMTDKQTYKLYMITGVTMFYMDVYPYTKGEASALIDRALNGEAYHVRVETAQYEGSKVSWTDVGKQYREDTKPKGYKTAMDMLSAEEEEEEPEEVEADTDPDEIAALEAQLKELKDQKSAPAKAPKGKTRYQKMQSLKAKYERELKTLEEQEETPPPAKVKKNKKNQSSDDHTATTMAVLTKLAEDSGVDVEKLIRMATAFSA